MGDDEVARIVREMLAVIPAGCSWLLPVTGPEGEVTDFRVAAASGRGHDIYHRGVSRVDELLSVLYPSIVGGRLWQLYLDVLAGGGPSALTEFRYEEKRAGIVARSTFDVTVHRVLGGLLVWWERVDEGRRRLENTERLGSLGWTEHDLTTGVSEWSPGMFRIFDRDPVLGPLTLAQQAAALLSDDKGLAEAAWQTMDAGATSDITVRFRTGAGIKHLRILSDQLNDADGHPLKINAVVQDVTAREDSRSTLSRLREQLHVGEMTALAEHRLAGRLQHMIQPIPSTLLTLPGLTAAVGYLPAGDTVRVGGDWFLAEPLPDGRVVLAVGDMAGHGLSAASGMARLRFSVQAWLSIGIDDPGLLLAHLNRLCRTLALTGTAVLGVYTPATRVLLWARAGHPPPLLARSGAADELPLPSGLLLGADETAVFATVSSDLCPGDLLLLYTDGLVERREGTQLPRVRDLLRTATSLDALTVALGHAGPDDDTCTLLAKIH